jgi:hypothetical protein
MQKSDDLLRNAENCAERADAAVTEPEKNRFKRMEKAWKNLADTQAWLDGEKPETPNGTDDRDPAA